ncbi:MAG TPA: YgjV family protein [Azospirillaceae bacterium]|nr:YgjV family protein [Azospirillaceae bacterium]
MSAILHIEDLLVTVFSGLDIFGVLGVLFGSSSGLFRSRRNILLCGAMGSTCFALHFAGTGAHTGAIMCAVSMTQSLAASRIPDGGARPKWLLPFCGATTAVVLGSTLLTWQGPASLFAASGSLLATLGRLQSSPQRMRLAFLACSLSWMGHNLLNLSVPGLAGDVLGISLLSFALHRDGLWRRLSARNRPFLLRIAGRGLGSTA